MYLSIDDDVAQLPCGSSAVVAYDMMSLDTAQAPKVTSRQITVLMSVLIMNVRI